MINDIKNSINKILNERLTSPFYGTFILAWLVWNWRILYLSFFVSEDKIETDKISYIVENFSDLKYIVFLPLISTIILITLIPFITNRAYWISLLYNQWKVNKRNEVQKKDLLTIEQSINLREQIKTQEKRFEELLEDKNLRIKQLEVELKQIVPAENVLDVADKKIKALKEIDINGLSDRIVGDVQLKKDFATLSYLIQRRYRLSDIGEPPSVKSMNFFISNNIISIDESGKINFTDNGKKVAKWVEL